MWFRKGRQLSFHDLMIIEKKLYTIILILKLFSRVRVMVFNTTFKNISAIWWQLVLLVEETRVPEKQ
jgi:hypothetical protein